MIHDFARGAGTARLALAALLGLAVYPLGCASKGPDSDDAVVVTEPGATVPTVANSAAPAGAGSGAAPAAPSGTAPAATPAVTATAPTKADGWGTFKGQVVFGGAAPAVPILEDKGKAEKDPQYCAKDAPIKSERLLVDDGSKGVKNVLVYFPKATAVNEEAKSAKSATEIIFDQSKCVFEPHVLGMMVGTKISLKSSDEVQHNINASKLQKNSPFNSLLAPGGEAPFSPTDAERSPILVTCDIHPWMQAYWMILDNPYFAVTDAKGNFEIKNVPAGTQKVVVWQEATSFVTPNAGEDVTIKANDTTSKTWTIDPGKVKPAR